MPQICFPNHVGLPWQRHAPTVDGYVEPEDWMANENFGVAADLVDPGWTGASRITFGSAVDGGSSGLGTATVAFQGIKEENKDYVHLCFVIRRDANFDTNDVIVLVLHPEFDAGRVAKTGDERRIHIYPNQVGIGVMEPGEYSPFSAGPDTWHIRSNGPPRNAEYFRWVTTPDPGWVSHSAATPSRPNNITIRVRSWTNSTPNQRNWSVEVRLPTNQAEGGQGWINLSSTFGFYFNVVRLVSDDEGLNPEGQNTAIQFPWPGPTNAAPLAGMLSDDDGALIFDEIDVPPNWLGEAWLGSSACTEGVRFKNGANGIGVGTGPQLTNQISRTDPNTFTARLTNGGSTSANNIRATFRIANWGIGPNGELRGDNPKWNMIPPPNGTDNPTTHYLHLAPGGEGSATMQWQLSLEQQAMYGEVLREHQCIWVTLESDADAVFAESSVRRNFDVVTLSTFEREAEVSGAGYPDPAAGSADQEMLLFVSQMVIPRYHRGPADKRQRPLTDLINSARRREVSVDQTEYLNLLQMELAQLLRDINRVEYRYVWITDGYRKTGLTLTINGTQYQVYEPADSFGYLGKHIGPVASWNYQVTEVGAAGRLEPLGEGRYRLRVPNGGAVRIKTRLEAVESPIDAAGCRMVLMRLIEKFGPFGDSILRLLKWK